MRLSSKTEPRILISKSLASELAAVSDAARPLETGGFLFGARRGCDLEIAGRTLAGDLDIASPVSFERRSTHHAREIAAQWGRSKGHIALIGDWHSHPVGAGAPSSTDRKAWRRLVQVMSSNGVAIIFSPAGMRVLYLRRSRLASQVVEYSEIYADESDLIFGLELRS